jgi:hypothetical protein
VGLTPSAGRTAPEGAAAVVVYAHQLCYAAPGTAPGIGGPFGAALAHQSSGQLGLTGVWRWAYGLGVADEFSERYGDLLTGSYDCVDRILLKAFYPLGHNPGGFRVWWRRLHGDSDELLDNTHLARCGGVVLPQHLDDFPAADGAELFAVFALAGHAEALRWNISSTCEVLGRSANVAWLRPQAPGFADVVVDLVAEAKRKRKQPR